MAISDKLTYLNTTKTQLKDMINKGLPSENQIDNSTTFRNYVASLYDAFVRSMRDYSTLWGNMPKVSGTGTNITINNVVEAPMKIELEGNTYQETTLGTNYFNANNITSSSMAVAEEGKTITITAVTSGNGARDTGKKLSQLCPNLQVDDVVYLYFTRSLGTTYNNFIYLVGASIQWTNGTSKTITQAMLDSNVYLYANRFQDGETGNCILTDFRIVKNTTDTWEKFTYGKSPNPQYPQEVQVVTGNNTIKVENKNLMTYTTYNADTQRNMQMPNLKLKAGTYAISFDLDSFDRGTNTNFDINMNLAYEGGGSLDTRIIRVDSATTTGRKNATFTLTSDTTGTISNNIRISTTQYNNGARAVLNNIQIESGSTATDYIAHQGQEYTLNLGKNLVGTLYQGGIDLGGSGGTTGALNRIRTNFIKVDANSQYTISNEDTIVNQFGLGFYDKDRTFIGAYSSGGWISIGTGVTITPIANAKYIMVAFRNSSNDNITPDLEYKIQIEKGAKTSYSPYFTPIELCKIGTYKDYLYKSGDKWYKHTEIGKVVLDETDSWSLFFNTNGVFVNTSLINAISDSASINCISDNFTGQTRSNIRYNLDTTDGEVSTSGTELVLSNKSLSTTTDFQTWLSTHNTSVYYILATATEEEITNSDLINQLNSLLSVSSYEGQTNIIQVNDDLAFNLEAQAIERFS